MFFIYAFLSEKLLYFNDLRQFNIRLQVGKQIIVNACSKHTLSILNTPCRMMFLKATKSQYELYRVL